MNDGQSGTGVWPAAWRRQPTVPSMKATSIGGVPPIDSPGPDVNTVPGGITWPGQPSSSQAGEANAPDRYSPRGSVQASPKPGGVSVPALVSTTRGATSAITQCTSTGSSSTRRGQYVPGRSGPPYRMMLPHTQWYSVSAPLT